jgi:hypothetical protein
MIWMVVVAFAPQNQQISNMGVFGCQPKHATPNCGCHSEKVIVWFSFIFWLPQLSILSFCSPCLSSSVWQSVVELLAAAAVVNVIVA